MLRQIDFYETDHWFIFIIIWLSLCLFCLKARLEILCFFNKCDVNCFDFGTSAAPVASTCSQLLPLLATLVLV